MVMPRTKPAVVVLTVLGWSLSMVTPVGAVPNPTVTGPIPASAQPGDPSHDYPFFSFAPQLAALKGPHTYVEPPNSATAAILDGGHAYKTRMIVRRPSRLRDFSGVVFVEWPTTGPGHRRAPLRAPRPPIVRCVVTEERRAGRRAGQTAGRGEAQFASLRNAKTGERRVRAPCQLPGRKARS